MKLTTLLFSFDGRINRGKWWLTTLILAGVWTTLFVAFLMSAAELKIDSLRFSVASLPLWWVRIILPIAAALTGIAFGIKRLHDRDQSG